jgi:hypothetical protein
MALPVTYGSTMEKGIMTNQDLAATMVVLYIGFLVAATVGFGWRRR